MLDESTSHYREIIDEAIRLMSIYFQKSIRFSKVIQLSEPDRRNIILRLLIDNPTTNMPRSLILKKTSTDEYFHDQIQNVRVIFVAKINGTFCGYVILKWQTNHQPFSRNNIPEISDLNVLPQYRKMGIGTKLIQACEQIAKECDTLKLASGWE